MSIDLGSCFLTVEPTWFSIETVTTAFVYRVNTHCACVINYYNYGNMYLLPLPPAGKQ